MSMGARHWGILEVKTEVRQEASLSPESYPAATVEAMMGAMTAGCAVESQNRGSYPAARVAG